MAAQHTVMFLSVLDPYTGLTEDGIGTASELEKDLAHFEGVHAYGALFILIKKFGLLQILAGILIPGHPFDLLSREPVCCHFNLVSFPPKRSSDGGIEGINFIETIVRSSW